MLSNVFDFMILSQSDIDEQCILDLRFAITDILHSYELDTNSRLHILCNTSMTYKLKPIESQFVVKSNKLFEVWPLYRKLKNLLVRRVVMLCINQLSSIIGSSSMSVVF